MTSTGSKGARDATTTIDPGTDEKYALIGRIASGLAHELNGPIGIALGFTELARELLAKSGDGGIDGDTVTKVNEYLGLVENAGLRARTLARQIWNFAKAEPGSVGRFDLAEALAEAAALAAPAVKVAQIEIGRRGPAPVVAPVMGDRALLTRSLVRLFLDSSSSLPQGGMVAWEVTARANDRQEFVLAAEPWGDVPSVEWRVTQSVKEAFWDQGGSISDAVTRAVAGTDSAPAPSHPGWYVTAGLPVPADS